VTAFLKTANSAATQHENNPSLAGFLSCNCYLASQPDPGIQVASAITTIDLMESARLAGLWHHLKSSAFRPCSAGGCCNQMEMPQ
jgi:hypothetical protein